MNPEPELEPEPDLTTRWEPVPEPEQSETPFAGPWPLPDWPDVPTRVLAGREDRLFTLEFQRRVTRERLGLEVEVIPGGHLAALSHPDEVAAGILRAE